MLHVWVISCTKEYFFRTSLLDFPNPWHKKYLSHTFQAGPVAPFLTTKTVLQIQFTTYFAIMHRLSLALKWQRKKFAQRPDFFCAIWKSHFCIPHILCAHLHLFCIRRLQTFRMSSVGMPTTVTTAGLNRRKSMTSNKTMTSLASTNTNGHSSTCAGGQTLTTPLLQQKPPTKLEHNTQEIV